MARCVVRGAQCMLRRGGAVLWLHLLRHQKRRLQLHLLWLHLLRHQKRRLQLHLLWLHLLRHQKRWLKRSARPMRLADEPTWRTAW